MPSEQRGGHTLLVAAAKYNRGTGRTENPFITARGTTRYQDAIHLTKHTRARIRRSPDQPTRWRYASNTQQTRIFICLPPPSRHFMYAMPPLLMPTPTYRSTCRTYHGRTSRSSTIPPPDGSPSCTRRTSATQHPRCAEVLGCLPQVRCQAKRVPRPRLPSATPVPAQHMSPHFVG